MAGNQVYGLPQTLLLAHHGHNANSKSIRCLSFAMGPKAHVAEAQTGATVAERYMYMYTYIYINMYVYDM